jgi:serine/threonine protein kinase
MGINEKKLENLSNLIDFSDDEFKINLNNIKNIEEIGEGTSSIVFKGKIRNEYVAIKMFKSVSGGNFEDFKQELKFISKLKNKYTVNFNGYIFEKNKFGIVLEYCENGNLKSYIKKNKNIKWKNRLKFLVDISKGMEFGFFYKFLFFLIFF